MVKKKDYKMKRLLFFYLFLIVLFTVNCGSFMTGGLLGVMADLDRKCIDNISKTMNKLENTPKTQISNKPELIILKGDSTINYDLAVKTRIDSLNPVLAMPVADSILTNFIAYNFNGEKGDSINLDIKCFCHKFGMSFSNKYFMVPYIFIIDSKLNIIVKEPLKIKFCEPLGGNWYYRTTWQFTLEDTDKYFLVICPDNRYAGKKISYIHISTDPGFGIDIPVIGMPSGKIEFCINKNDT